MKWTCQRGPLANQTRTSFVYLGRFDGLGENVNGNPSLAPRERLRDVLGEDLCERVLSGFVAVLGRTDLPHASAIAQIHCAGNQHEA